MNIIYKYILTLVLPAAMLTAVGQTITFDKSDYKAIGVYDTWEQSPFRTGKLEGNAQALPNHLRNADNPSPTIVGLQRSVHGSNTFGVRVDLQEPFRLTKALRYVHVLVYKPVESRVLVCGLGKRTEAAWQWQDGSCEQFKSPSASEVPANRWVDVVVPINGFSYAEADKDGIEISSLVICPDVRSPKADESDFACYIDQIEINDDPTPRIYTEPSGKYLNQQQPDLVRITEGALNGQILSADGQPLGNTLAPHHKPYTIKIAPAPGFTHRGVVIRSGFNTAGPQFVNGKQQFAVTRISPDQFNSDGTFTLPADVVVGAEVHVEGQFVEVKK